MRHARQHVQCHRAPAFTLSPEEGRARRPSDGPRLRPARGMGILFSTEGIPTEEPTHRGGFQKRPQGCEAGKRSYCFTKSLKPASELRRRRVRVRGGWVRETPQPVALPALRAVACTV